MNLSAESININASSALTTTNGVINLTTDQLTVATTAANTTGSSISIQQQTAGREIRLGNDSTSTTLNLTDAELDKFVAQSLSIGNSASGDLVVTAAITQTGKHVNLTTGSNVQLNNVSFSASTLNNLTITTGANGYIRTTDATGTDLTGQTVTLNAGSGGIGQATGTVGISATNLNSTSQANANQFLRSITGSMNTSLDAGSGSVRLDAGTFVIAANERINDATSLIVNGATFNLQTFTETVAGLLLSAGTISGTTGTLVSSTDHQLQSGTVTGRLGGNVGVVKSTSGLATLTGVKTYTGSTRISEGTLSINGDSSLGTAPATTTPNHLIIDAGATLAVSATTTLDSKRGIAIGPSTGTGVATISVGSGVTLNYAGIIADQASGSGNLTKAGLGTLTLSGINTYTGGTSITAGTLSITNDRNLGALPTSTASQNILINGGTLLTTGTVDIDALRGITIGSPTASGLATISVSGTLNYAGVIADNGTGSDSLTKTGTGKLVLTGANTYTGSTTIIGILETNLLLDGGVASGIGASTNSAANLILGNGSSTGTLRYVGPTTNTDRLFTIGTSSTTGDTVIDSSGTGALRFTNNTGEIAVSVGTTHDLVFTGTNTANNYFAPVIKNLNASPTNVLKEGTGTWELAGANLYTGTTTLTDGKLVVQQIENQGVASNLGQNGAILLNGGTLTYTGNGSSTDRTLQLANMASPGTIEASGTGALEFTSAATVTVTGNTTRTLRLGGTGTGIVSTTIPNPGSTGRLNIIKQDGGTWQLNGPHSYSGATTVQSGRLQIDGTVTASSQGYTVQSAGELRVNGQINAGTGLTVQPNGILSGNGSITSGLTTNQGNIAPGSGSAGIFTTQNISLAAGSNTAFQIGGNTPGNAASNHDQLVVNGTVNIANTASLTLNAINGFVPAINDQYVLLANNGPGLITGTFAGLTEGALINNFLGTSLAGRVSYTGGDGNDFVITVQPGKSTEVALNAQGDLVIEDGIGGDNQDRLTLQADTNLQRYILTDPTSTMSLSAPLVLAGATMLSANSVAIPFSAITGTNVFVNLGLAADTFTLDFSLGNLPHQIHYDGGGPVIGPGDSLTLSGGGVFNSITHQVTNASSGSISVSNNPLITYTGLEPIADNLNAVNRSFIFSGLNDQITLSAAGAGFSQLDAPGSAENHCLCKPDRFAQRRHGRGRRSVDPLVGKLCDSHSNHRQRW